MTADDYLEVVRQRLAAAGFRCREGVRFRWQHFRFVADKARFDFVGMPTTLREVFVFADFAEPDAAALKEFSAECWQFAESERPPRTLLGRLLGEQMCVYAVALAARPAESALEHAREETPPNHFGAGWEIPLVYDAHTGVLHRFRKVPLLGNAFYGEFKKVIARRLAPPRSEEESGPAEAEIAIDGRKAERFVERLRGRQRFVLAVAAGLPTAAAAGFIGGGLSGMTGAPLEWLAWLLVGVLVGTVMRYVGQGLTARFGVAAAALTLAGCLFAHAFAVSVSAAWQAAGVGNFDVLGRGPDLLRLAWAAFYWPDLMALALAVFAAYALALRHVARDELADLAPGGPPP